MKVSFLILVLFLIKVSYGSAQPRILKGTVYTEEGKRASGVIVTAHKTREKYYTSFDGTYEITARVKTKWLKFKFPDKEEKLKIENIKRDVIDFKKRKAQDETAKTNK